MSLKFLNWYVKLENWENLSKRHVFWKENLKIITAHSEININIFSWKSREWKIKKCFVKKNSLKKKLEKFLWRDKILETKLSKNKTNKNV